jgi:ABC-type uncharacterized transport system ATPase subunit
VNHLFGAYRTLKMQIVPYTPESCDLVSARLQAKFTEGFSVSSDEEGWIDITINQEQVLLRDVLSFMMAEFKCNDVKITEISMGNVIQKVYEGSAL